MEISDEFRDKMAEWVELKRQLKAIREDVKTLNTREKDLSMYIKNYMKVHTIDNVNLRQGKVAYKKSVRKATFSKKVVYEGLNAYFEGNQQKVDEIMEVIDNMLQINEKDSISLTGIKA